MKKFLRLYTRMTNCCFIFSLQAGAVIMGVLGVVWTGTSLLINLFLPYETSVTGYTVLQYVVAYLVLILICGGHVWILLAASWAHPNLVFLACLYNTGIMLVWLMLSMLSYLKSPGLIASICIQGRCPDVLWLFDTYWRDTGVKCASGTGDANLLLATRNVFSIAPMLGYIGHWPDYVEQPGLGVPCYVNIPDTANYVSYIDSGNSSCPRADWLTWRTDVERVRYQIYKEYYEIQTSVAVTKPSIPMFPYPRRPKREVNEEDFNNDYFGLVDENSALNGTFDNKTTLFNLRLEQGCELDHPRFIVVSLAFSLFFACFFLYGRAVEFNYYHEMIAPFTLERGRFRPPKNVRLVNI